MTDFTEKIRRKGQADENIYFAELDRQLIKALHEKQGQVINQQSEPLSESIIFSNSLRPYNDSVLVSAKLSINNRRSTMNYQHILVAIDLSDSSEYIINKAVSMAKMSNADISLIYVDVDFAENYTGLSYSEFSKLEPGSQRSTTLQKELKILAEKIDYPISNTLFESGDLNKNIQQTVQELGADLLVCGHHHDFWSGLLSSARKLVKTSVIDIFIVQI